MLALSSGNHLHSHFIAALPRSDISWARALASRDIMVPIGALQHFGYLTVAQAVDVAQHERFAKWLRQCGNGCFQRGRSQSWRSVWLPDIRRHQIDALRGADIVEVVKIADGICLAAAIARQPGVRGVAHDGQKPGSRIAASIAGKTCVRLDTSILHHVFRVGDIASQPSSKRKSVAEMRQNDLAESFLLIFDGHSGLICYLNRRRGPRSSRKKMNIGRVR